MKHLAPDRHLHKSGRALPGSNLRPLQRSRSGKRDQVRLYCFKILSPPCCHAHNVSWPPPPSAPYSPATPNTKLHTTASVFLAPTFTLGPCVLEVETAMSVAIETFSSIRKGVAAHKKKQPSMNASGPCLVARSDSSHGSTPHSWTLTFGAVQGTQCECAWSVCENEGVCSLQGDHPPLDCLVWLAHLAFSTVSLDHRSPLLRVAQNKHCNDKN